MASSTPKDKASKIPLRSFFGRIFNNSNNGNENDITKSTNISQISGPFNTVHRIHVGFDGTAYSGLPHAWLEILHRDLS